MEAKATAGHSDQTDTLAMLNAALSIAKASASENEAASEALTTKLREEINILSKTIEDADAASRAAEEKHNVALDSRQSELDGLQAVIKSLQDEIQRVSDEKNEEHEGKVTELKRAHEEKMVEAAKALERAKSDHQTELRSESEMLATQLEETKIAAQKREAELLAVIQGTQDNLSSQLKEAERLRNEETETFRKSLEEQRSLQEMIVKLKEDAAAGADSAHTSAADAAQKYMDLQNTTDDHIRSLTEQLDALRTSSEVQKRELSEKLENKDREQEEAIDVALVKSQEEINILKENLETLMTDALVILQIAVSKGL